MFKPELAQHVRGFLKVSCLFLITPQTWLVPQGWEGEWIRVIYFYPFLQCLGSARLTPNGSRVENGGMDPK